MALTDSLDSILNKYKKIFSIVFKGYDIQIGIDSNISMTVYILGSRDLECYDIYHNFLETSSFGSYPSNNNTTQYIRLDLSTNKESLKCLEELYDKNDESLELYLEMQ